MAPLRHAAVLAAVAALSAAAAAPAAEAQSLTQDEALALAFPDAERVERRTAYLEDAQLEKARSLAGPDVEVSSGIVTHYVAVRGGEAVGVAYFDAHRVRTLQEVLMIVVDRDARVRRLEVVSFREPPEYRPPGGWLRQFDDAVLEPSLSLKGDIANITGATLTAGAVSRAVRRTLALHAVIAPLSGEGPEEPAR